MILARRRKQRALDRTIERYRHFNELALHCGHDVRVVTHSSTEGPRWVTIDCYDCHATLVSRDLNKET